jgi:hypothetical protein
MSIHARDDCCSQEENAKPVSRTFEGRKWRTDHSATPRPVVAFARLHVDVDPKANVEQDAAFAFNFLSAAPFCMPFAVHAHEEANADSQKIVQTESKVKKM